jgi:hypothetical protein
MKPILYFTNCYPSRWRLLAIFAAYFLLSISGLYGQTFVHPGVLHKQPDFERMKTKVTANAQPWKGSYDLLVASAQAQLSWSPRATATIIRGGTGDNVALLYNDVAAAYQHALLWKITGNAAHGDKARDILNAWSATHTTLSGNADRYLASGLFGYQFANAAEMMRGYSGFDVARFQNYLLNVYYYPLIERFLWGNQYGADHNDACITNYWANWDLCNMAAAIAIGVFCDNRTIFNRAIDYFKTGAGNGSINHAIPFLHPGGLGQWQESGRDQGHSILGVGLMASFCEIAWNQGQDMYGWNGNRFMQGAEYVARYNNGASVPFTAYSWGSGTNCSPNTHTAISSAGRGENRPIWEMIYNHYARRRGLSVANVASAASELRPEGGPGGHATTFDQPGFGSLTYSLDATQAIADGIYQITARHSGKVMEVANNGTANGSNVQQWSSNGCVCQQWHLTNIGNNQYVIVGIGSAKNLDVNGNATADGANIQVWQWTGGNNQRFTFTSTSGGYYRIVAAHSGKAVDVANNSTTDGANIQQWPVNNCACQEWRFTPVSAGGRQPTNGEMIEAKTEQSEEVSVHPNPATNEVNIKLPSSFESGIKSVYLFDVDGNTIQSEEFESTSHTMRIGDLPQAFYLLKIIGNNKVIVKKLIKR